MMMTSDCTHNVQATWKRFMNVDPWRFIILYFPVAWFLSTRFRNWEMSIIIAMILTGVFIFVIRKHPHRMVLYAAMWCLAYYIFVGLEPLGYGENFEEHLSKIYTELIAVEGSRRYERSASFLKAAGIPFHVQFNGKLKPVPWEEKCKTSFTNKARYAEFFRLRLLELAETHADKDWIFILEDDAEPVHFISTFKRRFNYALTAKAKADIVWLDYRNIVTSSWIPFPYGGITGILFRRTSVPAIAKTLEFDPEHCETGTGLDEIWSAMCHRKVLKCEVVPIIRENGQKTSLFVGLRPLDSFST